MTNESPLPARSRIVRDHLRDAGVTVEIRELPDSTRTARDAALALGCPLGAIASSLLFLVDGAPTLVMTSGRHRVDPAILATRLGAAGVELAAPKQVKKVTGQAIGGVAPVGHPVRLPAVIDEALGEFDVIWAAAGTPHTVMPLTFDQLLRLTEGTVATVAST